MSKAAKKQPSPIRLKLDANSAIFFHRLAMEGHANYEHDPHVPEGEIHVEHQGTGDGARFRILRNDFIGHL